MKDLIEERNKKERMRHSIVKWWNVHYMTPEELEAEQGKESDPDMRSEAHRAESAQYSQPGMENTANAPAAAEQLTQETTDAVDDAAQEIIRRLQQEAAEDEARKMKEIEQARLMAEANFNEATGSYSGSYGSGGVDEAHQEQIDAILAEKDDALRNLIEQSGDD